MSNANSITRLLWARRDETAREMRDALVSELPGYANLSGVEQGLLLDEMHYSLSLALQHSAVQEPNTESDLEFFHEQGDRRGHTAFPLADLVEAGDVVAVVAHKAFWQVATPHNFRELIEIQNWSACEVPRAIQAAVAGYIGARSDLGQPHPGLQLLVRQLLEGHPAMSVAEAAGITLAPSYMVLMCSMPPSLQTGTAFADRIAAHVRAIPGALHQLSVNRLVVLLPVHDNPYASGRIAADLVTSIAQQTGHPVQAAQAHRSALAGIPDAVTEATEVLTLLTAIPDAANRPYVIDELLVELAIAARPDIVKRLAAHLAPLDGGTDLHTTLQVLYACELDRDRTAKALHIHRRTLTYRLARIQQLCGIDPTTPHGIALLRAALTATRMSKP